MHKKVHKSPVGRICNHGKGNNILSLCQSRTLHLYGYNSALAPLYLLGVLYCNTLLPALHSSYEERVLPDILHREGCSKELALLHISGINRGALLQNKRRPVHLLLREVGEVVQQQRIKDQRLLAKHAVAGYLGFVFYIAPAIISLCINTI